MKLKRLIAVADRIKGLAEANGSIEAIGPLYYFHNGSWWNLYERCVPDELTCKELDITSKHLSWFRPKSSSCVYFRVAEFAAVICVRFFNRPRHRTLQAFFRSLRKEVEDAKNAFLASHDAITECLNKNAIDQELAQIFRRTSEASGGVSSAADIKSAIAKPELATYNLSLDLDHFKFVNDNFGHLYGDLVLRAFAWRVDTVCEEWLQKTGAGVKVLLARPGGEEFQIVVCGSLRDEQVTELAEEVRRTISDRPLPAKEEFDILSAEGRCEVSSLPHESERRVTVSIGIASLTLSSAERPNTAIARMLRQSDLALYSAKGGGRNAVRSFGDILKRYGKVLVTHPETSLISIDVGSEAGVRLGQEFLVFPPDFSGEVPYYFGEGRSRRRLGVFPRYPAARIAVVDVQPELSFCRVEHRLIEGFAEIPEGSSLEAIPLGAISHLITKPGKPLQRLLPSVEDLRLVISSAAPGTNPPTGVFQLIGLHDYASAKGIRAANEALANIFDVLVEVLGAGAKVAMVNDDCFAVVAHDRNVPQFASALKKAGGKIHEHFGDELRANIGYFDPSDYPTVAPQNGIELALLAAALDGAVERPAEFTDEAAVMALYRYRTERKFEVARADTRKLFDMGLRTAPILIQAALVEYAAPDGNLDLAVAYTEEAIKVDPDPTFKLNLATLKLRRGDVEAAYNAFSSLDGLVDLDDPDFSCYLAVYAMAAVNSIERAADNVDVATVRGILQRAEMAEPDPVIIPKAELAKLKTRLDTYERARAPGLVGA